MKKTKNVNQSVQKQKKEGTKKHDQMDLLFSFGLALLWPLFQKACIGWVLPPDPNITKFYIVPNFVLGLTFVLFALAINLIINRSNRLDCLMKEHNSKARLSFACIAFIGYWTIAIANNTSFLPSFLTYAGIILDAFGIVMLIYLWTTTAGGVSIERILYVLARSLVIGWAVTLTIDILPYWVSVVVLSTLPLCSTIILNKVLPEKNRVKKHDKSHDPISEDKSLVLTIAIFLLMVVALWMEGNIAATPSEITLSYVILQDVISLIAAVLFRRASSIKGKINLFIRKLCLAAVLMLFLAVMAFYLLKTNITIIVAEAIIRSAVCFIQYILWLWIINNQKDDAHLSKWPALFVGALGFSWICEQCFTSILEHYVHLDASQLNVGIFFVVIAILAFCTHFFIKYASEPHVCVVAVDVSMKEAVDIVAERYELTDPQTNVMLYRAKGRSYTYIGDKLSISKHTANDHMKKVHKALKIHTKDELVDMIEKVQMEILNKKE